MTAVITITEAIDRLRDLHQAGFDLPALLRVAKDDDPELATTSGIPDVVAARYRETLSHERGAPSLDEFRAVYLPLETENAERLAHAWADLGPRDRVEAIAEAPDFIRQREAIGRPRLSGAAYLTGRSWQFVASRRKLGL